MNAVDWTQLAAIAGVMTFFSGVGLFILRSSLAGVFAERKALEALIARVTVVEQRVAQGPTGDDMRELYRRMGAVEVGVASAASGIEGVKSGVGRVEHMMGLLLQNELTKEKSRDDAR